MIPRKWSSNGGGRLRRNHIGVSVSRSWVIYTSSPFSFHLSFFPPSLLSSTFSYLLFPFGHSLTYRSTLTSSLEFIFPVSVSCESFCLHLPVVTVSLSFHVTKVFYLSKVSTVGDYFEKIMVPVYVCLVKPWVPTPPCRSAGILRKSLVRLSYLYSNIRSFTNSKFVS